MTQSTSIAKLPSAGSDVNLDVFTLDKSKLSLQRSNIDDATSARTAEYTLDDGDPYVRKSVSVKFGATDRPSKSGRALYTRNSILVESPLLLTDDVTEIVTESEAPLQVVIAINVPIGWRPTASDLLIAVEEAFSLCYSSVTSGAADTGVMSDIIQGNAKYLDS